VFTNKERKMDYAIEAEGLVKRFGDTVALAGVDFVVQRGSVLGTSAGSSPSQIASARLVAETGCPTSIASRASSAFKRPPAISTRPPSRSTVSGPKIPIRTLPLCHVMQRPMLGV
jgi:hypothetical protein